MATHLIGLLGRKRSGKDTFAQRLVEEHGYKRFAFADALRQAAEHLDPIIAAEAGDVYGGYGELGAVDIPGITRYVHLSEALAESGGWEGIKGHYLYADEARRVLQHMGTGVRELDEDFWLRVVMEQVRDHDGPAVITDVRFPNEHWAVSWAQGFLVRITRPGLPTDDLHISETALDDHPTDATIANDMDVARLHEWADTVARAVDHATRTLEAGDGWPDNALQTAFDRRP